MRKFWAALGSAVFFVIAPGTVAGFLPWAISRGEMQPALFGQEARAAARRGLVPALGEGSVAIPVRDRGMYVAGAADGARSGGSH